MRYNVVDSAEFTYPDIFDYPSGSESADVFAPRGGYTSFQVVLEGLPENGEVCIKTYGFEAELYSLYPVFVEANARFTEADFLPHMPERVAPFYVYDALMPYRGSLKVTNGRGGLYVAARIAPDAKTGVFYGTLKIGELSIPVSIKVFGAAVPDESLRIIQGYAQNFERYHGVKPGTPEFERLGDQYLGLLRRMRQNMMYVSGVKVTELGNDKYEFDFSSMEKQIERRLGAGMTMVSGPPIGKRKSWKASTILLNGKIPAMSYEGYCYLSQYLPALHDMLKRRGWLDRFVMGVADEPNEENAIEYRALCGLVRRFVPDIKLMDAMGYVNVHGAIDIWIPRSSEYQLHQKEFDTLRLNGGDMWDYVCCVPRGKGFINRFLDYALLCTRYLFWGNYRYNLSGYLHWAVNNFQNGISARSGEEYHQDPFAKNCPEHHNTDSVTFLPPGDTHLIYPGGYNGNGGIQEPWLSIRAENQRMSAEEYEFLRLLSCYNKPLADEICGDVFRAFDDVEYDVNKFNAARYRLLDACEKLGK